MAIPCFVIFENAPHETDNIELTEVIAEIWEHNNINDVWQKHELIRQAVNKPTV